MADDKKNIPNAGKVAEPTKPGKTEPIKDDPPVQDQHAPAKTEAPVIEDVSKVITPPAAEQPAPADREAPKTRLIQLRKKRGHRIRARTRSKPRSPAGKISPPLERWRILPSSKVERQRDKP